MKTQELVDMEHDYVAGVYSRPSFILERGEGSKLYDNEGHTYIDCVAGIAVNALGYNDAGTQRAIQEALGSGIIHISNLYLTEPHVKLAKQLCETSFADKVHFCNSGAEANEGAFKFARRYARENHPNEPEKYHILAFTNAFHGRTFGAVAATPREKYQAPFRPLMPGVRFAEFNNLESAREQMDGDVCAIIVEPIQGEGGIHLATQEFLQGLRDLAHQYDAVLIFDEVQCGMGRSGTLWAYEYYGVEPDILTSAKPLAGGLPIGAILLRDKVASAMHKGEHGSTFAGGLVVTHVANYVLNRVNQPQFLAEVTRKGNLLKEMLEELNSPHIVQVRGRGLIAGVELDIDTTNVVNKGYEKGLLLVNAGTNVVRFVPPLIITEEELRQVVKAFGEILQEV